MSLLTFVQAVIQPSQLVQLTNPDGGPGTVNTTLLGNVISLVQAEFLDRTGVALDDSTPNNSHLALGVRGVLLWLKVLKGLPLEVETRERDAWYRELYAYAKTALGGLNWVPPTTDSQLTPTGDSPDGSLTRPRFDPATFNDVTPNAPGSTGIDPDAGIWTT